MPGGGPSIERQQWWLHRQRHRHRRWQLPNRLQAPPLQRCFGVTPEMRSEVAACYTRRRHPMRLRGGLNGRPANVVRTL